VFEPVTYARLRYQNAVTRVARVQDDAAEWHVPYRRDLIFDTDGSRFFNAVTDGG